MNKFRVSWSLCSLLGMDTANAHAVEKLLEIRYITVNNNNNV